MFAILLYSNCDHTCIAKNDHDPTVLQRVVIHECVTFILKLYSMLANESGGIILSGLWDSVILN